MNRYDLRHWADRFLISVIYDRSPFFKYALLFFAALGFAGGVSYVFEILR